MVFESHTHNHNHKDYIETRVNVTNGARATSLNITDGFMIDLTLPVLVYLEDSETGGKWVLQMLITSICFSILSLSLSLSLPLIFTHSNGYRVEEDSELCD